MKEPNIQHVKPPTSEPQLRVGIVLEDDKNTEVTFVAAGNNFNITGLPTSLTLEDKNSISVKKSGDLISVNGHSVSKLELVPTQDSRIQPRRGISISPVRAGRGFHWQKDITAIFSGSIEVLPAKEGLIVVNKVSFEDYVASVISSEMSGECPVELAKAQAVTARSWGLVFLGNKHTGMPYSICNDDCCQRYQGTTNLTQKSLTAVTDCRGEILVSSEGNICPAYYSKSCGGKTDTIDAIFGLTGANSNSSTDGPSPVELDLKEENNFRVFLTEFGQIFCSEKSVTPQQLKTFLGGVDVESSYFRWNENISSEVVLKNLAEKFNIHDASALINLIPGQRGESGRLITMEILYLTTECKEEKLILNSQFEIRNLLHQKFLKSSAFVVESTTRSSLGHISSINLLGAGWGHGVGLCQIGALGMALSGESYRTILKHYYPSYRSAQSY